MEIAQEPVAGRFLCFELGQEQFAIPLLKVKEVIAHAGVTPIPQSPAHLKGIINLRGQVISIADLRTRLKITGAQADADTAIIILDLGGLALGVIVDSVTSVIEFSEQEISPAPGSTSADKRGYFSGVAKRENSLTLILDLDSLFSENDRISFQTKARAG